MCLELELNHMQFDNPRLLLNPSFSIVSLFYMDL